MRYLVLFAVTIFLAYSCRISRMGKDYPDPEAVYTNVGTGNQNVPVIQPQRQADGGTNLLVTLDEGGKLKEVLGLRLDYFPPPRPDGVSLPTCYAEIDASTVLGRITCEANSSLGMDLLAGHVRQQCYTASPMRKLEPRSELVLQGCQGKAVIKTIRYSPDVKLEVIQ